MNNPVLKLTMEQRALLRRTLDKNVSDDDFERFVYMCERSGLDPFARQIYAVTRWDGRTKSNVTTTQASIDGFRLVAERTNEYCGQVGPFWCGKDGVWSDVWTHSEPPYAARVGVWRKDFKEPLYAVARFDAYKQTTKDGGLTVMWRTMGDLMIAKCAEALALRRAFPQDLSGLYTPDEMRQQDDGGEESLSVTKGNTNDSGAGEDYFSRVVAKLNECKTPEAVDAFQAKATPYIKDMEDQPFWYDKIVTAIKDRREELLGAMEQID